MYQWFAGTSGSCGAGGSCAASVPAIGGNDSDQPRCAAGVHACTLNLSVCQVQLSQGPAEELNKAIC